MTIQKLKIVATLSLCVLLVSMGQTQERTIGLEEALSIARANFAGLERDRLLVHQQNKLANAGLTMLPTQFSLSGEEFGVHGQTGIHSFNVQQNFYSPKAVSHRQNFYRQGAKVAEMQLALTGHDLKREVEQSFYQLVYTKLEKQLVAENIELYNNFLEVTTAKLRTGETGKIPQLAARSRLGQAQLEQEHALETYQIALTLFNQWLQSDVVLDASGELVLPSDLMHKPIEEGNPHLRVLAAKQQLAIADIEREKAQLLPQFRTGLSLQGTVDHFPLFGYQLGVNVPLFKKSFNSRIEAAEIGVKAQEASLKAKQQQIDRTISELRYRLEHQQHILEYLKEELEPIVKEQNETNLKAYGEGEIGYLEYLDGLEQVVQVKHQNLDALYQLNVLRVELNYWLGK